MKSWLDTFLTPLVETFDQYLLHALILAFFHFGLAYLIQVAVLKSPLYRSRRDIVDEELRAKNLGWMLALACSLALLSLEILYIYLKHSYEQSVDLSPHLTVVALLFGVWIAIWRNLSEKIRTLSGYGMKTKP